MDHQTYNLSVLCPSIPFLINPNVTLSLCKIPTNVRKIQVSIIDGLNVKATYINYVLL